MNEVVLDLDPGRDENGELTLTWVVQWKLLKARRL